MNLDQDLMYDKRWKHKPKYGRVAIYLILFVVTLIVVGYDFSHKEPKPVLKSIPSHGNAAVSPRNLAMTEFFRRKGSPDPQRMATAVLQTSRPRLMASIAIRESHGNPKAVGDGGKSKGAFQVQVKHWRSLLHEKQVSKDPVVQALDSERIIEDLIESNNGNLRKALNAYNGDLTKRTYAQNILRDLEEIP